MQRLTVKAANKPYNSRLASRTYYTLSVVIRLVSVFSVRSVSLAVTSQRLRMCATRRCLRYELHNVCKVALKTALRFCRPSYAMCRLRAME